MSELYRDTLQNFLSPIAAYLEDESVSEIMINGPFEIFVEKNGVIQKTEARFEDETALGSAVQNIAQFVKREINERNPTLDARLPDGSRIHVVLPPCARKGTTVAIRKFKKSAVSLVDLVQWGALSKDAARFLDVCVFLGKNIVVAGGTGSGKTTLLNVLSSRIPKSQRLLVIEDSSELQIDLPHVVLFETKMADEMGEGEVSIRDLVRSAMRLRPDRIIVGEVRGPEAMDLINVMNTGHDGSMGTVHANSPADALVRLETLALMGNSRTPPIAIQKQLSSAVDLIVQSKRFPDGSRKISQISEAISVDSTGTYELRDLFRFQQSGKSKSGKVLGSFVPCGALPSFMTEIEINGLPFDREKFQKKRVA